MLAHSKSKLINRPYYMKKIMSGLENDIITALPNFETLSDAKTESDYRQKVLLGSGIESLRILGTKLSKCSKRYPCDTAACSVCFRYFRQWFYAQLCSLCDRYDEAYILTIVYYDEYLSNDELFNVEPKQLKQRLYQQLKRSGFKHPVTGCLEMDFHPEIARWLPHFHLLILGDSSPIGKLRQRFFSNIKPITGRSTYVNRPIYVSKLRDKGPELSYLCKSYWSRVEAYMNPRGKRCTKKYRLKPNELRLSLRVLDRIGFKGLLFMYGIRRHGFKLDKSVVSEQELESRGRAPW